MADHWRINPVGAHRQGTRWCHCRRCHPAGIANAEKTAAEVKHLGTNVFLWIPVKKKTGKNAAQLKCTKEGSITQFKSNYWYWTLFYRRSIWKFNETFGLRGKTVNILFATAFQLSERQCDSSLGLALSSQSALVTFFAKLRIKGSTKLPQAPVFPASPKPVPFWNCLTFLRNVMNFGMVVWLLQYFCVHIIQSSDIHRYANEYICVLCTYNVWYVREKYVCAYHMFMHARYLMFNVYKRPWKKLYSIRDLSDSKMHGASFLPSNTHEVASSKRPRRLVCIPWPEAYSFGGNLQTLIFSPVSFGGAVKGRHHRPPQKHPQDHHSWDNSTPERTALQKLMSILPTLTFANFFWQVFPALRSALHFRSWWNMWWAHTIMFGLPSRCLGTVVWSLHKSQ